MGLFFLIWSDTSADADPLGEDAPPGRAVREHEAPPDAALRALDDGLPGAAVAGLIFAAESRRRPEPAARAAAAAAAAAALIGLSRCESMRCSLGCGAKEKR